MEWVYDVPSDEPVLYEADALETSEKGSSKPIDIFSSKAPVEEPISEPDTEPEYYGDEDVVEERVSPIKAFETFAGKTFPTGRMPDFSGSIYAEASDPIAKLPPKSRHLPRLQSSESRSQRLARLQAEVEALRSEYNSEQPASDSTAFSQLSSLRDQLGELEKSIRIRDSASRSPFKLIPQSHPVRDDDGQKQSPNSISLHFLSPSASALSAIDQRVSELEKKVGICDIEEICDDVALGTLLDDVKTRLALVTDPSLPARLKHDAQDVARILQNELQEGRGAEILRAATALDKMERWKNLAESVPLVVERLRSLKRVQEEAEQFSASLGAVSVEIDNIQRRSETNSSLIENVRRSLSSNAKIVEENLNMLDKKIADLKSGDGSEPLS